jgi:Zn-dependent protease/CBS domain-containing protein
VFRHTIPLGRIMGILIDVDYSWFLIFALLTWALAVGYFPATYKGWSTGEYWFLGAVASILLFVCVLLHELGHSSVALRYKIPVREITLFIFGGVSQITAEPPSAGAEFLIAVAGPAVSFALAAVFWGLQFVVAGIPPLLAVVRYMFLLNLILGVFNLIPGFPLDGGRVFRAIVWGVNHNFRRATMIAAVSGRFFGFLFIFLGAWWALSGQLINGLWIAFIGWFLESAAGSQAQQQVVKDLLAGHTVSEVMTRDYARIPGDVTLQELVEKHILGGGRRAFVVTHGDAPAGLVTLANFRKVDRSAWPTTTANEVMIPREKLDSVGPQEELWAAAEKMGRDGVNQLPVMQDGRMVGMLSRDDVVHYLSTLRELSR